MPTQQPTPSIPVRSRESSPPRQTVLIVNPAAGRGKAVELATEAAIRLRADGCQVEVRLTGAPGDGQRLAASASNAQAIVAVGGDGTFNEVLNGARDLPVPLGLIPVGTANVLSRELGIPRDVARACAVIVAGKCRAVDVGLCGDRRFVLMAGIGFDAAVVERLVSARRGSIRIASYAVPIAQTLATYDAPLLRVEADGRVVSDDGRLVIVCNARNYACGLKVSPSARMDDGQFDVCVFRRAGLAALLRHVANAAIGRTSSGSDVVRCRAAHVAVCSDSEAPYQLDGDFGGHLPTALRIVPGAARILCPGPFRPTSEPTTAGLRLFAG